MTSGSCQCGCTSMVTLTEAQEPCGCGCACCEPAPKKPEDEIAELRRLRSAIDERLGELQAQ